MCVRNIRFLSCPSEDPGWIWPPSLQRPLCLLLPCCFPGRWLRDRDCRATKPVMFPMASYRGLATLALTSKGKAWSQKADNTGSSQYQGTGDTGTRQPPVHGKSTVCSATFSQLSSGLTTLHSVVKHENHSVSFFLLVLFAGFSLYILGWTRWTTFCLSLQSDEVSGVFQHICENNLVMYVL